MEKWKGRVALVTGASRGIGAAITEALAQSGMIVVGVARDIGPLEVISRSLPHSEYPDHCLLQVCSL